MITVSAMAGAFARNVEVVKMQAAGLTHADSLAGLPFRGNCLNWVIGHLVTNRNNVLKLLGAEDLIDPSVARYERDSEPIPADGAGALPLEELLEKLDQSQAYIARLLGSADPSSFQVQVAFFGRRSMPVGEWLLFFLFHDSYHVGQTEILRQAAGKDDKII